jgi:hypothetical protein
MNISGKQLRRAADIQDKIESLQKELNELLGSDAAPTEKPERKRRKMSAAARAKIGAAQRARWAKTKADRK